MYLSKRIRLLVVRPNAPPFRSSFHDSIFSPICVQWGQSAIPDIDGTVGPPLALRSAGPELCVWLGGDLIAHRIAAAPFLTGTGQLG